MRVQQTVRDRDLSLQQSAIHETLASNRTLPQEQKEQIELDAARRAIWQQQKAQNPSEIPTSVPPSDGNVEDGPLFHWFRNYSSWDASWIKAVWLYFKYYVIAHLPPTYRDWRGYVADDLDFGVIKRRLPSRCRVLMIGDWGTHMPDNAALLRQALNKFKPEAIIHLGDVYYSGTVDECTANVLDIMNRIYPDKDRARRPPFFAIPGNHDYYSGGGGFYHTIDTINSGIPDCTQQASFFCLRTEDNKWQFLGMDTGYNDRVPTNQLIDPEGPDLRKNEMEWHRDKLEKFPGSTILLSHHQLISAKEQLNRRNPHYLNQKLYRKFGAYFDRISAWYWGHEHNLILFENDLKIDDDRPPLKKGRLLGCSAYEEDVRADPFEQKYAQARFMDGMKKLGKSKFMTGDQSFYNHAFAILDVSPDNIVVDYYEYPSWGLNNRQSSDPPISEVFYSETLSPRTSL